MARNTNLAGGGRGGSVDRRTEREDEEEEVAPDGDPGPELDPNPTPDEVEERAGEAREELSLSPDSDPDPMPVDEDDATGRDDEVGNAAREFEREVREEHTLAPEAVAVRFDEETQKLRAELTDEGAETLRRRRRANVRLETASETEEFGPGDFIVRETDSGEFNVELTDDAREEAARRSVGDELEDARPIAEEAPDHPTPEEVETVADVGGLADFDADELEFEATEYGVNVDVAAEAQRDRLRQRVAARDDRLEPQDIVVEETEDGFTARGDEDALAEALRQDLADEHEGVEPEDVEITIEDGEVSARAEVKEERRRLRDLVDIDVGFDRTALVDVDRRPISIDVESNIDAPDLEDLDRETIPPTAVDNFEASVLNDVLGGAPAEIREVEEEQLGPRATRERDFTDDLMDEVTERIDRDAALSGAAAAGAVGVAAPEPASSIGGAGVLLGVGAVAGAGIAVDAARRNELDVSRDRVEEVGVGASIVEEELEVSEDIGRTTQVEMAERVAELDVAEQNLAEIDIPADEFVAGTSPQMAGQIGVEEPRGSIRQEDTRTDIQRLIEDGDDVFEGRRDPRGAFREERDFPTGESAVIGREVERVEKAQSSDLAEEDITRNLEEFDVAQQLEVDVSPLSAPLSGLDPMSDTVMDLDVGLDAAGQQVQALEAQSALQQQQLLQETTGAPGFSDPTLNTPGFAEGLATGTGFATGPPPSTGDLLPPMIDLNDPVPSDRRRDEFDLTGVEVEFEVPTAEEVGAAVGEGLDDVGIDTEDLGI